MNLQKLVLATALVTAVLSTQQSTAQTSYPMLMSLDPAAAVIGEETEHTINARYSMYGATEIIVSGKGVIAEVFPHAVKEGEKIPSLTAMKIKVTVAADAEPGVRDFRVLTPRGVSTVGQMVIARDSLFAESGDNNTTDKAQAVVLPATICGRIERAEDVDYFQFAAKAGIRYVFHVQSMRLQNRIHDLQQHIDPLMAIRSANGSTLAVSDNRFFADPFIEWDCPADGDYLLELRDVRYQGNTYWTYCVEAHSRPYVFVTHPIAVKSGEPSAVTYVGAVPDDARAGHIEVAEEMSGTVHVVSQILDEPTNPFSVLSTHQEVRRETEKTNNDIASAQPIELTEAVAAVIESEGDIDLFQFSAVKGQQFNFEVAARRLGSSLDSVLRILDSEGKSRSENDDLSLFRHTHADSRIDNWSAPADGDYFLEVRDLHLRGGSDYPYVLTSEKATPDFELYLDTAKTQLTPGTSGVIFVNVDRQGGFSGAVDLSIEDLPDGVSAECGRVSAGQRDGCIILTAAPDARLAMSDIKVFGTATVATEEESVELQSLATPLQETYQPGGGRGHWPVSQHIVAVSEPGDLLSVDVSPREITLKPGESVRVDVEIVRTPGFEKNVQLDRLVPAPEFRLR